MDERGPSHTMTPEEAGALLRSLAGTWEGIQRTWFEPGNLADESPIRGTIRPLAGSNFIIYEYVSSLQGQAFTGAALFGFNVYTGRFEMSWADSFHSSTNLMVAAGEGSARGFWVLGSYADPNGGPDWGWRTALERVDDDHLTVTAYNILPTGEESKALEAAYARVG